MLRWRRNGRGVLGPPEAARSERRLRTLIVTMGCLCLGVTQGAAQKWEPMCGVDCELKSTERLTLGDDAEGIVGPDALIARIGAYYYVSDLTMPASIQVFTEARGYEGVIGREGQGPGEYQMIMDIDADPTGRLWVLDAVQGRLTILEVDGVASSVVTTVPLLHLQPARRGVTLLGNGLFLLNAGISTPHRIGSWTHLVDQSGELSWSVDDDPERAKTFRPDQRFYALDGAGGFWSVWSVGKYRIEHRRLADGSLMEALEPQRAWFEEHQETIPLTPGADSHTGAFASPARIRDAELRGQQLWVLGSYGDDGGLRHVIDVFDLASQRLLYSEQVAMKDGSYFSGFLAPDVTVQFEMTGTGTRLHLLRMAFAR